MNVGELWAELERLYEQGAVTDKSNIVAFDANGNSTAVCAARSAGSVEGDVLSLTIEDDILYLG